MHLDTALKDCTRSIELSESRVSALDSRAMVYYRMNRFDDALADLTAALDDAPELAASLYMRGIIPQTGRRPGGEGGSRRRPADLAADRPGLFALRNQALGWMGRGERYALRRTLCAFFTNRPLRMRA